ncbi:Sterol regulatory element-binding protein ECM22 [Colletotrichum siamense]|uniref:Sterol regulatory element-binding protein ECM22 n=1 Tax=Colletotrichum siamense TaxID=690259 RepID=UPI0018725B25|nr:Sterol regulatory element-binding protein ECM22 [Colletotrichum siamense]KAF5505138.1 Sterol regulatory element-binding protein ECM22 [Colletotrichum siamense]
MADDTESASATAAAATGGAGGSQQTNASKTRHKRTRTGCLKCRIRRRKCDEGKPRCQRCIDGNFECQYGPRLTFLNKNALTVSPSPRTATEATTPKYSRLQFVSPGTAKQGAKDDSASPPPKPHDASATNNAPPPPHAPPAQTPTIVTFQANPQPLEPPTPKPHPIEPSISQNHHPPPPPPPTQWRAQSIGHESLSSPVRNLDITGKLNGTSPNNDAAYETALNVLLSLGSEGTTTSAGLVQTPDQGSGSFGIGADGIGLDLCDMSQTFGLYVPRLAIESEGVLHALLAVAATTDSRVMTNDAEYLKTLAEAAPWNQNTLNNINDGDLAHLTLSTACRFITDIPSGWHELPIVINDNFWAVALAEASQKTIAILSVLIRLELAAALVTGSPISVPEQLNYNPMSQQWNTSSAVAETIFQYTIEPLLLCAKVVNFCSGSFPPQTPTSNPNGAAPLTPVHRWTMLSDALGLWYTNRAQEFRPMVEIDGGDDTLFPIILFTNGAAVFANQLYHTAMLLLLQNKPRTLQAAAGTKKSGGSSSSATSPLWHAQRVCGIALNNDRRDSWDLCLVASLYLAAQRMTYEPQQRAILECFERVKALAGWNVDGFAARVREDWGLV